MTGWAQPFLVCLMLSGLLPLIHRRLHPRTSAVVLAASVVWIAAVGAIGVWLVAVRYLGHVGWIADQFPWCSMVMRAGSSVPPWLGWPAVALMTAGIFRVARFSKLQRALRNPDLRGTTIVASDEVFAFVVPGHKPATVVSSGLLRHLGPEERSVVFAHEHAHAQHRHDRYLMLSQAAEALFPPVRILNRRLEFSLERWADAEAVTAMKGDRLLVARTIAKVALLPQRNVRSLARFSGLGDAARTQVLLDPPGRSRFLTGMAFASSGLGLTFALYQLHHFYALVAILCRTEV